MGKNRSRGGSSTGSSEGNPNYERNDDELSNMFNDGYQEVEVESLRGALGDSYFIRGYNDDKIFLEHIGIGEGDTMRVNIDRSALRSLTFNEDENLPALKEILEKVDDNVLFRQLVTDFDILSPFPEDNPGRTDDMGVSGGSVFSEPYVNAGIFDGASRAEFDERMDELFDLVNP